MKCSECPSCIKGFFKSKPEAYVCTGVKHPFVIDLINNECPAYPEKRNEEIPEWKPSMLELADHILKNLDESDKKLGINDYAPTIKDSGDRTQFESGAVRDMREGKGRCDLMPLEVVANYVCECNDDTDHVLWGLREFQKTNSTAYLYSVLNAFDARCWDNPYTLCLEVAKHFEEGAKKYNPDNWRRGIPTYCYIDSAIRHYLKWLRGDNDEPHGNAFVWNVMCCIWEVDYHKESEETK